MKKIVYTKPEADMILLNNYDVIQTSSLGEDNPDINLLADDSNGLATAKWKTK